MNDLYPPPELYRKGNETDQQEIDRMTRRAAWYERNRLNVKRWRFNDNGKLEVIDGEK